ncbi:MAG: hypothetical protein QG620_913, partial [Patescibacteria group bacterium]|nr:hypothetical protein [Patescibacteria group bacterium]
DANYVQITQGQNALFEDYANKDFHIKSGSQVRNAGADLTSDTYLPFTTDIDGHTRNVSSHSGAWDIGADESATAVYFSAGQNVTTHETGAGNVDVDAGALTATFTVAQTATNMGVGDVIDYDSDNKKCFITGKTSTSVWTCVSATGTAPTDSDGNVVVNSITHSFASLSLAEAGAPGAEYLNTADLWSNNYQLNIPCYYDSGADETAVTIEGYTTGVPNYIKVYTPNNTTIEVNQSQRHQGKWDEGKYQLTTATFNGDIITNQVGYTQMLGLQLHHSGGGSSCYGINSDVQPGVIVKDSIFKKTNATTGGAAVFIVGSPGAVSGVINSVAYGGWYTGFFVSGTQSAQNAGFGYNLTSYGNAHGYRAFYAQTLKNCIGAGNTTADFSRASNYDVTLTNCASSDGTADDFSGSDNKVDQLFSFIDSSNNDFHLSIVDTSARNAGADLSTDSYYAFTTDIDNNTRNTDSRGWDIGADEAATPVYFSVSGGGDTSDKMTGTPTVDIASGVATFSAAQTGNIGVGDVIDYGSPSSYAYITGKTSTSVWTVQSATGASITGVDDATVNSITRAFTTLSGAEAGASGGTLLNTTDLLTNNYQLNLPCYYDTGADTTAVTIDGWTTAPTNYIKAYTPNNTTTEANNSQRHSGKWDDGKWRLEITSNSNSINIVSSYVQIEGIQLTVSPNVGNALYGIGVSGTLADRPAKSITINSNIVRNGSNVSVALRRGISFFSWSAAPHFVYNNIFYGFTNSSGAAVYVYNDYGTNPSYLYNNTAHDSTTGFYSTATRIKMENNVTQNCADGYFSNSTPYVSSDYNLSDLPNDAPSASYRSNLATDVVFIDETNKDFHLALTDPYARDAGADLSADTNLAITNDIDGQTRPTGTAFDIGADESQAEIYYSVGQNIDTHETGAGNVTVSASAGTATFTVAQEAVNMGVGDVIDYDSDNKLCYISEKISTSVWKCQSATGGAPTATSGEVAVNSIHHAFASLSLAEAGAPALLGTSDLVAGNYILNIPCYYDTGPDQTAVTVDGYTTGSGNYIRVYTPYDTDSEVNQSQRHQGKWDEGKYNISTSGFYYDTIYVSYNDFVHVDGLQVKITSNYALGHSPMRFVNSTSYVSNCIIDSAPGANATSAAGITITGGGTKQVYIWNSMIYFSGSTTSNTYGIYEDNSYATSYNNTVSGFTYNYWAYSLIPQSFLAKNSISQNSGTMGFYEYDNTIYHDSSTNNLSDRADAPGSNPINSATVSFVDAANFDFHLYPNDTSAIGAGTDLSEDSNLSFDTDIDGNVRTRWDIGADEKAGENKIKGGTRLKGGVRLK